MFAYRMAIKPFFFVYKLLIWTTLSLLALAPAVSAADADAQDAGLADELRSLTPACARPCVADFVAANYPERLCGPSPSLQCLCTRKSTGGFTIGEGAALCLGGARATRICGFDEVTGMCGASLSHPLLITWTSFGADVIRLWRQRNRQRT